MCGLKTFFSISTCSSSLLSKANKRACAVTMNPDYMLLYAVSYVLWSVCVGSCVTMMNEHQRWSIVTAGSTHVGMRSASQKQTTFAFSGEVSVSLHTLTSHCATSSSVRLLWNCGSMTKARWGVCCHLSRSSSPVHMTKCCFWILDIHIFLTRDQINAS